MKFATILLLGVLGYFALQQYKPAPPPPPPAPPPPAILSEPAPVINEAEQAKILKSAEDPDANVRWEAIMLLDKMKSKFAMPLLIQVLEKDLESHMRIRAIHRLAERRSPEVTQAIVGAMRDQDPDVRLQALRTLQAIGDYSVAPLIAAGPLKDQEESVRLQALQTLNSLQDKKQAEIDAARHRYEQQQAAQQKAALEAARQR